MAILGIDVGTSGPKAAIYSNSGAQLALSSQEYPFLHSSANRLVLHPKDLWKALRKAVRSVTATVPDTNIEAVSISSHGETFIPVDSKGEPIGPFILNVDSRGTEQAAQLFDRIGHAKIAQLTGLPSHGMYTLPKVLWLRKHSPDVFRKATKFLCIEDHLLQKIGIGAFISHSLASRTLAFDIIAKTWSEEILSACDLNPSVFASAVPSGTPLGKADPRIAQELGISPDAVWVAGAHDQVCSSLGGGGLTDGTAVDGTGTFECLTIASQNPPRPSPSSPSPFPVEVHAAPGFYLALAYVPGGIVPRWVREQLIASGSAGKRRLLPYDALLSSASDEPSGVFFFPYLFGTGTPWLNPEAQAAIIGLTGETTLADIARAGIEGVTFEMKWNIDQLESSGANVKSIYAVGGGARSRIWLQIKADIFGREVIHIGGEASCAGAAVCAGIGIKAFSDWEQGCVSVLNPVETIGPRPLLQERYHSHFEKYKELSGRLYGFQSIGPTSNQSLKEMQ